MQLARHALPAQKLPTTSELNGGSQAQWLTRFVGWEYASGVVNGWRTSACAMAALLSCARDEVVTTERCTQLRDHVVELRLKTLANIGSPSSITTGSDQRTAERLPANEIEVKNVRSLSYTQQLRDFANYARINGLRFDLWVRPDTQLSGPLEEQIANGAIKLRYIE